MAVGQGSLGTAHQPQLNGAANPQSKLRKRSQNDGAANGVMMLRSLHLSKKAPWMTFQSPSSHARTSSFEPESCRRAT